MARLWPGNPCHALAPQHHSTHGPGAPGLDGNNAGRDNRITDVSLTEHTVHSATFFASTSVVAMAALLGLLGGFDRTYATVQELAFTAKTGRVFMEGKLLLLLLVFAHTFPKLSWALRQLNYTLAMIGAAPTKPGVAQRDRIAQELGALLCLAVRSFNAGMRGYYFALAALTWLVGPEAFMGAMCGTVAIGVTAVRLQYRGSDPPQPCGGVG